MRHYLNATKICDCLGCNRQANELEEKKKTPEQEEKEKKVDDIAKAQEERKKLIQTFKDELKDLDDDELDKILESIKHDLEELKKDMNPEDDEKKQSKQASIEFLGVDSQISKIKQTKYSVLALSPYHENITSGDQLLIRMGSTDEHTVGNSEGDALLIKLGSVD